MNNFLLMVGLKLLLPIVEEIKHLKYGVLLPSFGEQIKTYGTLAVSIADNLTSYALKVFKFGFSTSFRKWSYC